MRRRKKLEKRCSEKSRKREMVRLNTEACWNETRKEKENKQIKINRLRGKSRKRRKMRLEIKKSKI